MNLIEITKEVIESHDAKRNADRCKKAFYVSDAGKCRRQMYYSLEFQKPMETNDAVSVLRMDAGKRIEEAVVDMWKEEGILKDDQARVDVKLTNAHEIHGYADAIITVDGVDTPVEIKSFWGHKQAAEIKAGKPKPEYVYQLALYMHYLGYTDGMLLYIDRSNMDMYQFCVEVDKGDIRYGVDSYHTLLIQTTPISMTLVSSLTSGASSARQQ